jgi:hypothetical protein
MSPVAADRRFLVGAETTILPGASPMSLDHDRSDVRPSEDASSAKMNRDPSGQIRDVLEKSRLEVAQLVVRVARVEDEIDRGRSTTRSLAWLAGLAAALGFVTTSLTWQLGHRAEEIDAAIRSVAGLMKRSAAATDTAFRRIDATLAAQSAAGDKLAAAIASIEATGRQMQTALAELDRDADRGAEATGLIGRQLTDTALELSTLRRELDSQLERHHDAFVAGRGEMLEVVTASIDRVEGKLLRQAEELRSQREQVDASAARMRVTQQRMLGDATEAVAAQLDGLRQILAGLREEIAEEEATVALEAATDDLEAVAPTIVETAAVPSEGLGVDLVAETPVEEASERSDDVGPEATVDDLPDASEAADGDTEAEPVAEVAADTGDTVTE